MKVCLRADFFIREKGFGTTLLQLCFYIVSTLQVYNLWKIKILGGFNMMAKLKQIISGVFIAVAIAEMLAGCTSNKTLKEKIKPTEDEIIGQQNLPDGAVIIQQDSADGETIMQNCLTDEELKDAAEKYQAYLDSISDKFSEIWPGTKAENYHVIITNGNVSYYVSNGNYEEIDVSQDDTLKNTFQMLQYAVGMYQPVTYKEENITAMNPMKMNETCTEDDLLRNFIILMHESFHLHSQSGWQGVNAMAAIENEQSDMRASDYPLDAQPRILRAMQYDCLYNALNAKDEDEELRYLENAKYWYKKWTNEYSEDFSSIKDTDLAEGTAEYFGNEIKRILQSGNFNLTTPEEFATQCQSADSESYNLGDIAIQLLKKRGEFKEVDFEESGKTPVEVLMGNIKDSIEEDENPKLAGIISDNVKEINSQISECFSDCINADTKGEMTYIGIDSESLTGIMSEGFYYLSEIDKTGWRNAFISNLSIQVNGKNVLEYGNSILIPVMESEITKKDDVISDIRTDKITLNTPVKFEKRSDERGNIIYQLYAEKD